MSLDVYIISNVEREVVCSHCNTPHMEYETLFTANITHNLGEMAARAGIYYHLWKPQDIDITTAYQLIEPLTDGLNRLKEDPEFYKQYEAKNGWGTYDDFVPWIEEYLDACIKFPDGKISVWV